MSQPLTGACGAAVNVYMPKDRVTNAHQGYGFVEFKSEEDADYVSGACGAGRGVQGPGAEDSECGGYAVGRRCVKGLLNGTIHLHHATDGLQAVGTTRARVNMRARRGH